jgi:5'-methylthioadenosine phosphorylase
MVGLKVKKLGIIGGSGLYSMELKRSEWVTIETFWGKPSDDILRGLIGNIEIYFLPRHGRGHKYSPTTIPYKANIAALKKCGVDHVISFSACGSLNEIMEPGHFVVIDQYVDRTTQRDKSFFGTGCVGHVSLADPTCACQNELIIEASTGSDLIIHPKGTYLAMEGPQFSTRAESLIYKNNWNCDVIGMTNVPEMNLAREAQLCYSSVSMVTDFDCWHEGHEAVTVTEIITTMNKNVLQSQQLLKRIVEKLENTSDEYIKLTCQGGIEDAIITSQDIRNSRILDELQSQDRP